MAGAASAVTVITGILLLLLAHALAAQTPGLAGGRRAARLSVVLHGLKAEPVAALIPLALLVVLIVYRAEFYALGDPTTRWQAVRALVLLTVVSLVIGSLVVALARAPWPAAAGRSGPGAGGALRAGGLLRPARLPVATGRLTSSARCCSGWACSPP